MAGMQDVIYFMVAGFNLIALSLIGVAMFQRGLFIPFLKVKMSGGKKIIVRVLHPVQSYFVTGELDEGFLIFRDRKKNDRRLPYMQGCIDRAAGVYWTQVDDEKNCMVQRMDGRGIEGHDAVKYDELYKRALYKPSGLNDLLQKVTLIGVILLLLVMIVTAILTFKNGQTEAQVLSTLQSMIGNTTSAAHGVVN